MNQVKAFFVKELGKYFIFKFSLFAILPASIKYRAMCSTVDSLLSLANLVNFGIFQFLGNSVINTYLDKADTKFGLCRPILKPFCANKVSTTFAMLFWPS